MKLQIAELNNARDGRGFSFTMPPEPLDFVGRIADVHVASTAPGAVRGNHYHSYKREAILLFPGTAWSLHGDEGEGMPPQHRSFSGSSAVLVLVSPGSSHAVRNDGAAPLWLVTCSSEPYDPTRTVARKVV
jgi:oxalate decarboxylase/phosphoglucose isomerase-like protein (cupin superfamily)